MNRTMLLRLVLDGLAAVLLIASLAYYWLGNLPHEIIGTTVFLLVFLHGWFNRRWYLPLMRGRYDARRAVTAIVNLGFLAVMAVLLVSSILVSRSLFGFLGFDAGFGAREVHMFSAYWVVAFLGVHIGLNWQRVMGLCRNAAGLRGNHSGRAWGLRIIAAAIAVQGVLASSEMMLGTKLSLNYAMEMWDFNAQTPRFFLTYGCILGLYAAVAHYALIGLRYRGRAAVTR